MSHPDDLGIPPPQTNAELDDATRGLTLRELVLLVWAEQKKTNDRIEKHIHDKVHPGAMTRGEAYGAMVTLALVAIGIVQAVN